MRSWGFLSTAALVLTSTQASEPSRCFPDDFLFGSATASYQVEGAWNETGRTPSIWDDFCRERVDVECANVADDFLHRYKDDIQLMVDNNLKTFRFSISWSRAMNWDSDLNRLVRNQAGIDFYHDLIDALLANGVVPILTLYHWDLPRELHLTLSPPGWLNSDIDSHFVEYAALMFAEFGKKVDYWTTFNEPLSFTTAGYGIGMSAPGMTNSTSNVYVAGHNVLISHAKAVKRFRALQTSNTTVFGPKARISIVLNADNALPLNASDPSDVAAADRRIKFGFDWFLQPIVTGEYPAVMREVAGENLPTFTTEESDLLKGSYDLFMLNHYTTHVVTDCKSKHSTIDCSSLSLGWARDVGVDESRMPAGARRGGKNKAGQYNCAWFIAYAPGYLDMIKWMHKFNTSADILLTENGFCGNEEIENKDQLWYYQTYLDQVYKAISLENIPVIGYTAWSLLDNYEWGSFNPRFGLFYVNFTSETGSKEGYTPKASELQRIPRLAARWFSNLAKTKCLSSIDPEFIVPTQDTESQATTWVVHSGFVALIVGMVALGVVAFVQRQQRRSVSSQRTTEASPLLPTKQKFCLVMNSNIHSLPT